VATQAIFAAHWRRDNLKKIASPSQAKNRSCSRGLTKAIQEHPSSDAGETANIINTYRFLFDIELVFRRKAFAFSISACMLDITM